MYPMFAAGAALKEAAEVIEQKVKPNVASADEDVKARVEALLAEANDLTAICHKSVLGAREQALSNRAFV